MGILSSDLFTYCIIYTGPIDIQKTLLRVGTVILHTVRKKQLDQGHDWKLLVFSFEVHSFIHSFIYIIEVSLCVPGGKGYKLIKTRCFRQGANGVLGCGQCCFEKGISGYSLSTHEEGMHKEKFP